MVHVCESGCCYVCLGIVIFLHSLADVAFRLNHDIVCGGEFGGCETLSRGFRDSPYQPRPGYCGRYGVVFDAFFYACCTVSVVIAPALICD